MDTKAYVLDCLYTIQTIVTKRVLNQTDYLQLTTSIRQAIRVLETGDIEAHRKKTMRGRVL